MTLAPAPTPDPIDADRRLAPPTAELLEAMLARHVQQDLPRLRKLWRYYRNPLAEPGRPGQGQITGLPARLTTLDADGKPREIVIENDIAWRIHAMVDFMFARPVTMQSLAPSRERADAIEQFLVGVFDVAGGLSFFQALSLLGAVYGYVDIVVRHDPAGPHPICLEPVEAPRAVPLMNPDDYRRLDAYAIHTRRPTHAVDRPRLLDRVLGREGGGRQGAVERTVVWSADRVDRYEAIASHDVRGGGRRLVERRVNPWGRLPVVHIQNLAQPFFYAGLSEVEPLIALQDELNTRLSDRANRVTFQSFKMYLGKGIEHFTDRPVGPGQMWATDNVDASIQAFGGDAASPSEDAHIAEIREAMDKASAVSPIATGLVRDRVGNLTSENALRIVMMGLLAKTEKKRTTYGQGLRELVELVLHIADVAGVFATSPDERRVRLDWPDPMPDTQTDRLRAAKEKLAVGVPPRQVLAELGYTELIP